MKRPAKELLKNNDVKRWYENLARGSKLNADIRLRRLNLFCHTINTTPTIKNEIKEISNEEYTRIENERVDRILDDIEKQDEENNTKEIKRKPESSTEEQNEKDRIDKIIEDSINQIEY